MCIGVFCHNVDTKYPFVIILTLILCVIMLTYDIILTHKWSVWERDIQRRKVRVYGERYERQCNISTSQYIIEYGYIEIFTENNQWGKYGKIMENP